MASDLGQVTPDITDNVKKAIRKDVEIILVKKVKVETKGERFESRLLALTSYRLYLINHVAKTPWKVEMSVHILDIDKFESKKPLTLSMSCSDGDKTAEKNQSFDFDKAGDVVDIMAHVNAALKTNFCTGSPDHHLQVILEPSERHEEYNTMVKNLCNMDTDIDFGPCGGFSRVYACLCDYYRVPYLEEVAWDVDTIYLSHNTKEFSIQDFDHLEQKEIVPIVASLEYNNWFTKLVCRSHKLSNEVCDAVVKVLKRSTTVEEVVLDGANFGRDFGQKVALALTANSKTVLHSIDLSNNSLEDRGLTHLVGAFSKLPHGLISLSLSDTGVTSKGVLVLGQYLRNSKFIESSLVRLNLSKNPIKADGFQCLSEFLTQPNALTHLDLAETEIALDLVFAALLRGCSQNLTHINLSKNNFTHRKGKDVQVSSSVQQFFSTTTALKSINVSDSKVPAEAVRSILQGLSENIIVENVELNVSSNELKSSGASVIGECIGNIRNIISLDISDNGFESDIIPLVDGLLKCKSIKTLSMGRNCNKGRNLSNIMEAFVKLISDETMALDTFSLADSKLKQDTIILIDALGTNETLTEIDISGNNMGDEGARMLAKALQINTKLRTIFWDKNNTTYHGFIDLSKALQCNYTLQCMSVPVNDAAQSLKPQTEKALEQIQKLLLRNHAPGKFSTEQAYRLQQGLLLTSTQQQTVDRLIVQLQDTISSFHNLKNDEVKEEVLKAQTFIQDADNLKQLLLKFYLCTSDTDMDEKFSSISTKIHQDLEDKMKDNVKQIVSCAKQECPHVTSENVKETIQSKCDGRTGVSKSFVDDVFISQAAAAILNKLNEEKLTVASVVADTLMDKVIENLKLSHVKLGMLLLEQQKEDGDEVIVNDNSTKGVTVAAKKARDRIASAQNRKSVSLVESQEEQQHSSIRGRRRPTVNRKVLEERKEKAMKEMEDEDDNGVANNNEVFSDKTETTDEPDQTDGRKIQQTHVKKEVKGPSPISTIISSELTSMPDSSEPKVLDNAMVKYRARPPVRHKKTVRPTRPITQIQSQEANVSEGLDDFYGTSQTTSNSVKPVETVKKSPARPSPPQTHEAKKEPPVPKPKPKARLSAPLVRRKSNDPKKEKATPEKNKSADKEKKVNSGFNFFSWKKNKGNTRERDRSMTTPESKIIEKTSGEMRRGRSHTSEWFDAEFPPTVLQQDENKADSQSKEETIKESGTKEPAKESSPIKSTVKETTPDIEVKEASKPARPTAPKFGIGLPAGAAGGEMMAEIKRRQEAKAAGQAPKTPPVAEKKLSTDRVDGSPTRSRLTTVHSPGTFSTKSNDEKISDSEPKNSLQSSLRRTQSTGAKSDAAIKAEVNGKASSEEDLLKKNSVEEEKAVDMVKEIEKEMERKKELEKEREKQEEKEKEREHEKEKQREKERENEREKQREEERKKEKEKEREKQREEERKKEKEKEREKEIEKKKELEKETAKQLEKDKIIENEMENGKDEKKAEKKESPKVPPKPLARKGSKEILEARRKASETSDTKADEKSDNETDHPKRPAVRKLSGMAPGVIAPKPYTPIKSRTALPTRAATFPKAYQNRPTEPSDQKDDKNKSFPELTANNSVTSKKKEVTPTDEPFSIWTRQEESHL